MLACQLPPLSRLQLRVHSLRRCPSGRLPCHSRLIATAPRINSAISAEGADCWPCPPETLDAARTFLRKAVDTGGNIVLAPERDADGLCSGAIMHMTLRALSDDVSMLPPPVFMPKGSNIHSSAAAQLLAAAEPAALIVLDQGSRAGPPLLPGSDTPTMIVDHHKSNHFPEHAQVVSASGCEPAATTSLLAYTICLPLLRSAVPEGDARSQLEGRAQWLAIVGAIGDPGDSTKVDIPRLQEAVLLALSKQWLAIVGAVGDLWDGVKWRSRMPELDAALRRMKRKTLGQAVANLNTPRRSAECDIAPAWEALLAAAEPVDIATGSVPQAPQLQAMRDSVNTEISRKARIPPIFSTDGRKLQYILQHVLVVSPCVRPFHRVGRDAAGRTAMVTLSSGAQIHPVIATRWATSLKGGSLVAVMCANTGYLEGRVDFAMRIPNCLASRPNAPPVDLVAFLQTAAKRAGPDFKAAVGDDFARGHAKAAGGSITTEAFQQLKAVLGLDDSRIGKPFKRKHYPK